MTTIENIRDIALGRLAQFGRGKHPITVCYLISDKFFSGVRYDAGPFRFVWKSGEEVARICRGDVLLETIDLGGDSEVRRAA